MDKSRAYHWEWEGTPISHRDGRDYYSGCRQVFDDGGSGSDDDGGAGVFYRAGSTIFCHVDLDTRPWVAQCLDFCYDPAVLTTLRAAAAAAAADRSNSSSEDDGTGAAAAVDRGIPAWMPMRVSLRWLYRLGDVEEDTDSEVLGGHPCEVFFSDHVTGPEVNSVNIIDGRAQLTTDADLVPETPPVSPLLAERVYLCTRFFRHSDAKNLPRRWRKSKYYPAPVRSWRDLAEGELEAIVAKPSHSKHLYFSDVNGWGVDGTEPLFPLGRTSQRRVVEDSSDDSASASNESVESSGSGAAASGRRSRRIKSGKRRRRSRRAQPESSDDDDDVIVVGDDESGEDGEEADRDDGPDKGEPAGKQRDMHKKRRSSARRMISPSPSPNSSPDARASSPQRRVQPRRNAGAEGSSRTRNSLPERNGEAMAEPSSDPPATAGKRRQDKRPASPPPAPPAASRRPRRSAQPVPGALKEGLNDVVVDTGHGFKRATAAEVGGEETGRELVTGASVARQRAEAEGGASAGGGKDDKGERVAKSNSGTVGKMGRRAPASVVAKAFDGLNKQQGIALQRHLPWILESMKVRLAAEAQNAADGAEIEKNNADASGKEEPKGTARSAQADAAAKAKMEEEKLAAVVAEVLGKFSNMNAASMSKLPPRTKDDELL